MTTATTTAPETRRSRAPQRWLWAGLATTVLVTAGSLAASSVISDHVQASYPSFTAEEVGAATTAYQVILLVVGLLGVGGWLVTLWGARRRARWTTWVAVALLLGALVAAVSGLTLQDTSGDVGLAPLQGWLQLAPCVVGALAVASLWRRR